MKKHYHLIGIGGVGMGAIASLLLAKGEKVSGSDLQENSYTTRLRNEGAQIFLGHRDQNLNGCDCVVYSSAISAQNPELAAARHQSIPIFQRAQILAELMNPQKGITIAGAHGKTTTSSLISLLLIQAGLSPTTMVGGIIQQGSYHANLGSGKYFVSEVDESDGSFLYFTPEISIITNIDYEHLDYYHNWDNILKAYASFLQRTKPGGVVIAWGDDARLRPLVEDFKGEKIFYGRSDNNDIRAQELRTQGNGSSFTCFFGKRKLGSIQLKIPGVHNILNAMAALGTGLRLSIDFATIKRSLQNFQGVVRRFQNKGEVHGILIIDDYGHHPTEIAATLQSARGLGRKRVIAIFQPHRYTRTKFLMDDFANVFQDCDYLLLTDIYPASEPSIEGIDAKALLSRIQNFGSVKAMYCPKEKIVEQVLGVAQRGDLILTLGAGDITKISDELIPALTRRGAPKPGVKG